MFHKCFSNSLCYRDHLMKAIVPQKNDDFLTASHERQRAPEGFIRMFLEKEENARRLETKTGKPIFQPCVGNKVILGE